MNSEKLRQLEAAVVKLLLDVKENKKLIRRLELRVRDLVDLKTGEGKWFQEKGMDWRKLENKRLRMEKNGHITTRIRIRVTTDDDERDLVYDHQLPVGNPNIQPSLPKEYKK